MFLVPIRSGMRVGEIHFLASGDYGNSYEHDALLRLYGEKLLLLGFDCDLCLSGWNVQDPFSTGILGLVSFAFDWLV